MTGNGRMEVLNDTKSPILHLEKSHCVAEDGSIVISDPTQVSFLPRAPCGMCMARGGISESWDKSKACL